MTKVNNQTRIDVTKYAIIIVIIITILAGISGLILHLDYSQMVATIGLMLATAAFYGVLYQMNYSAIQLHKIMAKPKLEVIFTTTSNSEFIIDLNQQREVKHQLKLSVINSGNAVTKLFQIDYRVPEIFDPKLEPTQGLVPALAFAGSANNPLNNQDGTYTISYFSDEKVYCFVNRPASVFMLVLTTRPSESNNYPSEFEIKYKIFGDWAETQEGILKVVIRR